MEETQDQQEAMWKFTSSQCTFERGGLILRGIAGGAIKLQIN